MTSPPTSPEPAPAPERAISYGRGGAGNLRKKSIDAAGYSTWTKVARKIGDNTPSASGSGQRKQKQQRRTSSIWSTASGDSRLGRLLRRSRSSTTTGTGASARGGAAAAAAAS